MSETDAEFLDRLHQAGRAPTTACACRCQILTAFSTSPAVGLLLSRMTSARKNQNCRIKTGGTTMQKGYLVMTDIQISAAALEAGARASYDDWVSLCVIGGGVPEEYRAWDDLEDGERDEWRAHARAAFEAMVTAWPGMNAKAATDHVMLLNSTPALILPITETSTKENNNG